MRDAFALLTTFGRRGGRLRAGALAWFPLVGVTLGAGLGCVWWASERLWPRLVAAALTVAADLALTGALHLDGLADAADGLLPHARRGRHRRAVPATARRIHRRRPRRGDRRRRDARTRRRGREVVTS